MESLSALVETCEYDTSRLLGHLLPSGSVTGADMLLRKWRWSNMFSACCGASTVKTVGGWISKAASVWSASSWNIGLICLRHPISTRQGAHSASGAEREQKRKMTR